MDLREVEAFIAVAEELHFRRAAERLGVSPSRISQAIQKLERQVGAPLFARTSRRVRLTSIGEELLAAWRPAVTQLEAGLQTAQSRATGGQKLLRVCFASTVPDEIQHSLTTGFMAEHKIACVRYVQPTIDLVTWLRRDRSGVFVTWFPCEPESLDLPRIRYGAAVLRTSRSVLMARSHPLAGRATIDVEELAGHALIAPAFPDGLDPGYPAAWTPHSTPSGRPIARTTREFGPLLEEYFAPLGAGDLAHLTGAGVQQSLDLPHLVNIPLTGLPPLLLVPIWSAARETPAIRAFATFAARLGELNGWSRW